VGQKLKTEELFPTGEFCQRGYGDCQSLVGINALLNAPGGKDHLAGLIEKTGDKDYQVTFPGRAPIPISSHDLDDLKLATSQDLGVRILEKATLKVHETSQVVPDPFKLYMGDGAKSYCLNMQQIASGGAETIVKTGIFKAVREEIASGEALVIGHIYGKESKQLNINGETINFPSKHAYTIFPNKDGSYDVENPHDTSKRIHMSQEQIAATFNNVFVGLPPGRNLNIDPRLNGVAAAAADTSAKLQEYYNTLGAYSLGADNAGSKGDEKPLTPAQSAAHQKYKDAETKLAAAASEASHNLRTPVLDDLIKVQREAMGFENRNSYNNEWNPFDNTEIGTKKGFTPDLEKARNYCQQLRQNLTPDKVAELQAEFTSNGKMANEKLYAELGIKVEKPQDLISSLNNQINSKYSNVLTVDNVPASNLMTTQLYAATMDEKSRISTETKIDQILSKRSAFGDLHQRESNEGLNTPKPPEPNQPQPPAPPKPPEPNQPVPPAPPKPPEPNQPVPPAPPKPPEPNQPVPPAPPKPPEPNQPVPPAPPKPPEPNQPEPPAPPKPPEPNQPEPPAPPKPPEPNQPQPPAPPKPPEPNQPVPPAPPKPPEPNQPVPPAPPKPPEPNQPVPPAPPEPQSQTVIQGEKLANALQSSKGLLDNDKGKKRNDAESYNKIIDDLDLGEDLKLDKSQYSKFASSKASTAFTKSLIEKAGDSKISSEEKEQLKQDLKAVKDSFRSSGDEKGKASWKEENQEKSDLQKQVEALGAKLHKNGVGTPEKSSDIETPVNSGKANTQDKAR
jgi:hypothetical protein